MNLMARCWVLLLLVPLLGPGRLSAQLQRSDSLYLILRGQADFRVTQTRSGAPPTTRKLKLRYRLHSQMGRQLWVALTYGGLEVARLLMRPDSFYMIDRVQEQLERGELRASLGRLGLQIGLVELQSLLVGRLAAAADSAALRPQSPRSELLRWQRAGITTEAVRSLSTGLLQSLRITQPDSARSLALRFAEPAPLPGTEPALVLPRVVSLAAEAPGRQLRLRLKHKRVELVPEPPTFRFQVPEGYRVVSR